jgi:tetratricopeptide (TPR) repeat protein
LICIKHCQYSGKSRYNDAMINTAISIPGDSAILVQAAITGTNMASSYHFRLAALLYLILAIPVTRAGTLADLVAEYRYEDAYQQGLTELATQEGNETFDRTWGIAALESGHYQDALFVFERLHSNTPNNPLYRFYLARSYFHTGSDEHAADLFQQTLTDQPPATVVNACHEYLRSIERRQQQQRLNLDASLGSAMGYDTNLNSATTDKTIDLLDGQLTASLDEKQRAIHSGYFRYQAALAATLPINRHRRLRAEVLAERKDNNGDDHFDLDSLGGLLQYQWQHHNQRASASADSRFYWLGKQALQGVYRAGFTWDYLGWQHWQPGADLHLGRRDNRRNNQLDNQFAEAAAGLKWRQSSWSGGLNLVGSEDLTNASAVSRNSTGIDLDLGWQFNDDLQLGLQYRWRHYRFQEPLPDTHLLAPGTTRNEYLYHSGARISGPMLEWLTLQASVSYQRYQSNVTLYEYHRVVSEIGVSARFHGL